MLRPYFLLGGGEAASRRTLPDALCESVGQELIRRIDEVDPLTCLRCGAQMKILAFIRIGGEPSIFWRYAAATGLGPAPLRSSDRRSVLPSLETS